MWFLIVAFLSTAMRLRWREPATITSGPFDTSVICCPLLSEATYGQNAARLIFRACRHNHIQPLLRRLHWLWMPERVSFRLAVLVYRCLHGSAPGYLASDLQRVSHLNARRRLRSSTTSALVAPRTVRFTLATAPFQRLLHRSGTVCRSQSGHRRRCKFSAAD